MKHCVAVPRVTRPVGSRWALVVSASLLVRATQAIPAAPFNHFSSEEPVLIANAPFSLDKVAGNLQRLADQVPEEGWHDRIIQYDHSGCSCAQGADEEASSDIPDEKFQVSPSMMDPMQEAQEQQEERNMQLKSYSLTLLQRRGRDQHNANVGSVSRSGCSCKGQQHMANAVVSKAGSAGGDNEAKPTGIWLRTCKYSNPDLVFWRLTNTAYLRGGIVLKETIGYTDSCKMCEANNLACNKDEVELKDGNCLCVWRMDGAEMQTMLLSCSACVTDCIGVFKTFDLGKPQPGMQKGICLRKKPHKSFDDIAPLPN